MVVLSHSLLKAFMPGVPDAEFETFYYLFCFAFGPGGDLPP